MEAKKVVENVQGINGGLISTGTLRLTDYHLVFCAPPPQSKTATATPSAAPPKNRESWITYPMLSYCALRPTTPASGQPSSIRIRCRDFTFVTFNFDDYKQATEVFDFVRSRACRLGSVEKLYAFSHKPLKNEQAVNGWTLYDPKAEFRRQGISDKLPDRGWRLTHINKDYTFCDTYPAVLAVPTKISDNVLKYARGFRSRNRIPALSYIHPITNATITRSSQPMSGIMRKTNVQDERLVAAAFNALSPSAFDKEPELTPPTSQPDGSARPSVDQDLSDTERYEDELITGNGVGQAMWDENGKRIIFGAQQNNLIVDARPTINAIANQAQGMGSENMDKYPFAKKIFLNIANIHIMRKSLSKVVEAIQDADISPLPPNREQLAQSGWLKHIHDVLDGSAIITRAVGISASHVLIHCSDGWDRTSQLSALSQLMLDPYYRTIEGFIVLVEKDWLSFGHMFRLRSGHLGHLNWFVVQGDAMAGQTVQPGENDGRAEVLQSALASARRFFNRDPSEDDVDVATETVTGKGANSDATDPKMVSPVFHQFLDCVYQLLRQNPERFEFNERFLRRLLYHLYSCQYGTFLYNSEKQRHDARAIERTSSVWDYFLGRRREFINPDYDATIDDRTTGKERIILPKLKDIRWWHQVFNRGDDEMNGALNAAATAETERANALAASLQSTAFGRASAPGTPPSAPSPRPPGLPTSQSVLTGVESSQAAVALSPSPAPSLPRRASADSTPMASQGALSSLRDGIAGLGIGKGMLDGFNNVVGSSVNRTGGSPAGTPSNRHQRAEQEMQEMT